MTLYYSLFGQMLRQLTLEEWRIHSRTIEAFPRQYSLHITSCSMRYFRTGQNWSSCPATRDRVMMYRPLNHPRIGRLTAGSSTFVWELKKLIERAMCAGIVACVTAWHSLEGLAERYTNLSMTLQIACLAAVPGFCLLLIEDSPLYPPLSRCCRAVCISSLRHASCLWQAVCGRLSPFTPSSLMRDAMPRAKYEPRIFFAWGVSYTEV